MSLKKFFISISFLLVSAAFLNSCKKGGEDFQTTPDGLRYKFLKQNKDGVKAQLGDRIIFQIKQLTPNDSVIFDSYKNERGTQSMMFLEYPHKASFVEALTMMSKGDSAIFEINVDSFYEKFIYQPLPSYEKAGTYDKFIIRIDSIIPKSYYIDTDKKEVDAYLDTMHLQFTTMPSGLRIAVIKKNEKGILATDGDTVYVDYTGKLPNGEEFDSSIPRGAPLDFVLGGPMQMIQGWTEACRFLHEGERAIVVIPYNLAYGPQGQRDRQGRQIIPAYSTLIFDLEIKKIVKPKM